MSSILIPLVTSDELNLATRFSDETVCKGAVGEFVPMPTLPAASSVITSLHPVQTSFIKLFLAILVLFVAMTKIVLFVEEYTWVNNVPNVTPSGRFVEDDENRVIPETVTACRSVESSTVPDSPKPNAPTAISAFAVVSVELV